MKLLGDFLRLTCAFAVVCALAFVLLVPPYWWAWKDGDKLSVTVINATTQPVRSVFIGNGPDANDAGTILYLGDVPPGERVSNSTHFKTDLGSSWFHASRRDGEISSGFACLLTDNGPFKYTLTVYDDHVHMDYSICSKGSGVCDAEITGR